MHKLNRFLDFLALLSFIVSSVLLTMLCYGVGRVVYPSVDFFVVGFCSIWTLLFSFIAYYVSSFDYD